MEISLGFLYFTLSFPPTSGFCLSDFFAAICLPNYLNVSNPWGLSLFTLHSP